MSRWAVIRVCVEDGMCAQQQLVDAFAPVTMRIDTSPPAAGPEWEFAVQDRSEADVCAVLLLGGISVLASKTTIQPLMPAPGTLPKLPQSIFNLERGEP